MEYSVGDLIIRIKNGYMAKREVIESPYSKLRENILKKLVQIKYIKSYTVAGDIKKVFTIELLYKDNVAVFTDVQIFSKPGRRWYTGKKKLKPVLNGMGYSILSTPKGIMTNIEAKKKNLGGELLFNIW